MSNDQIIVIDQNERPDVQAASNSIRELLDEGLSVQIIAARLNIDTELVLKVSDESRALTRQQADNGQRLAGYVEKLDEIIDLAHWQCKADPTANNIYAYAAAIEQARVVMQDIDGRRDNQKLTEDLLTRVLNPMATDVMTGMTQKLAGAKSDICSLVPPEYHAAVTAQLENILRALGGSLQDQLTGANKSVLLVLNDQKTDQKPKPTKRQKPQGR